MGVRNVDLVSSQGAAGRRANRAADCVMLAAAAGSVLPGGSVLPPGQ